MPSPPVTPTQPSDRLSAIFSALADPTRRQILATLADGEATVSELAAPFPISLPAISRHLKVLEHAGLISRSRQAQWRSSRLETEALREATQWMEPFRRHWDASLDRLDAHLERIQTSQPPPAPSDPDPAPEERTTP